jgi:excisionase family DNA binding protein
MDEITEDAMHRHSNLNSTHTGQNGTSSPEPISAGELPNRLLTAMEVAAFVGCHEETVRRAYWRGLLKSQRFGVRSRRLHPADVLDWIARGAPTKVL